MAIVSCPVSFVMMVSVLLTFSACKDMQNNLIRKEKVNKILSDYVILTIKLGYNFI